MVVQTQYLAKLSDRSTLVIRSFLGSIGIDDNTLGDIYLLGAPEPLGRRHVPFIGLEANEIATTGAFILGLGWQQFLGRLFLVQLAADFGRYRPFNDDSLALSPSRDSVLGIGLSFGFQSFIGPIKLTFSKPVQSPDYISNGVKTFLSVGHRF